MLLRHHHWNALRLRVSQATVWGRWNVLENDENAGRRTRLAIRGTTVGEQPVAVSHLVLFPVGSIRVLKIVLETLNDVPSRVGCFRKISALVGKDLGLEGCLTTKRNHVHWKT